jgi:hypothetical protein
MALLEMRARAFAYKPSFRRFKPTCSRHPGAFMAEKYIIMIT